MIDLYTIFQEPRKDNEALKLENAALKLENEVLKSEEEAIKSMIFKLNDHLCEKTNLLGDGENFTGLKAPATVSDII